MTLQEFLATANSDSGAALSEAKLFSEVQPVFITSNTLTSIVAASGLYTVFSDNAANANSQVRDICLPLMDRLRSESDFNLSPTLPMGAANLSMFDALIAGMPGHAAALTALKEQLVEMCNRTVHPFADATLHDVLIIRNQCDQKPVTVNGNYAVIQLTKNCEPHKPRLMAQNPRTGRWQRINNFANPDNTPISEAGTYDCRVPSEFSGWTLTVDDAYGAIQ